MSLVLNSSGGGSVTLQEPVTAVPVVQTLAAEDGTLAPIVSGTAQASTSGTSRDFTGIPSWAKRITVMFSGVSTNGTSNIQAQIGTSTGFETSGYASFVNTFDGAPGGSSFTTGYGINENVNAGSLMHGHLLLTNVSGNSWVGSLVIGATGATLNCIGGGSKSLSGTLDRIRITTVNGTDTFDAGTINILYE